MPWEANVESEELKSCPLQEPHDCRTRNLRAGFFKLADPGAKGNINLSSRDSTVQWEGTRSCGAVRCHHGDIFWIR